MFKFNINISPSNHDLEQALQLIQNEHDLQAPEEGIHITFSSDPDREGYQIQKEHQWTVNYRDTKGALRAFSSIVSGIEHEVGATPFEKFGIMLDCSRNGVMKIPSLKRWLRQLALLGYNQVMLYTEDTYQLPDEPYFGYLRGGYRLNDVKEIDQYAQKLGIEVVACIQTLGHLPQILKWKAYENIKDTERVLMIDNKDSYALIEKMILFWKEGLSSERIHIGMDETHDLGRGHFMDEFGYEDGFDLFNRHLSKVIEICNRSQLKPMIWSDMYFRLGSKTQDYYDKNLVIPEHAIKAIPKEAELVYWDYYNENPDFYSEWIERHRALGKEPIMASGIWTWSKFWYDHNQTIRTAGPCIEACRRQKVKELMFTMWGDDGAYCDFDSAFAGLTWAAEQAYQLNPKTEHMSMRFKTIFHDNFQQNIAISSMFSEQYPAQALLWDDPILNIFSKNLLHRREHDLDDAIEHFRSVQQQCQSSTGGLAGDHDHGRQVIHTILLKLQCAKRCLELSQEENWQQWHRQSNELKDLFSQLISSHKALALSFRKVWNRNFKPYGLEVLQIRIAGIVARYEELTLRLQDIDPDNPQHCHDIMEDLIERISPQDGELPYPHYINVASSSACISKPV
jgi:hypothetical protein